jgi:hypothetical protein
MESPQASRSGGDYKTADRHEEKGHKLTFFGNKEPPLCQHVLIKSLFVLVLTFIQVFERYVQYSQA